MTELLEKLTGIYGPSGQEKKIGQWLCAYLEERGVAVRTDAMGNVIAKVGGQGQKLVFSAHMDTVGLMLTAIDEKGFGSFTGIGWLDPATISHTPVRFGNDAVAAVCIRDDKVGKELKLKDLYLDFGTESRAETEKLVAIGDTAAFVPRYMETPNRITASFLDNRAGCAILLEALEQMKQLKNEVYFVFSVQEEVGTRGAGPAAFGIQGAGVKVLDHSALCRPELIKTMNRIAGERNIPVQGDIMTGGGTDAGPMAQSGSGMAVGGISLPCRYTHAPLEICDKNDFDACVRLVAALAETEL